MQGWGASLEALFYFFFLGRKIFCFANLYVFYLRSRAGRKPPVGVTGRKKRGRTSLIFRRMGSVLQDWGGGTDGYEPGGEEGKTTSPPLALNSRLGRTVWRRWGRDGSSVPPKSWTGSRWGGGGCEHLHPAGRGAQRAALWHQARSGPARSGPGIASITPPHPPPSPPPPPALGLSIPGGAGRDTAWERGEPGVGGGGGAAALPAPGAGGSRAVLLGRRAVMKSLY